MEDENFDFSQWFSAEHSYWAIGEYFTGDTLPNRPIFSLLGLKKTDFKPFTNDVLKYFENDEGFSELNLGVWAYSQFQDILSISVDLTTPSLENRHYCYYESLVYLRESIVSWLDKNVLAAIALERPFLELSILHIYWYIRCEDKGYQDYYKWVEGKKEKPPFKNQLEYVFSNLPVKSSFPPNRLRNIKEIIYNSYKRLSSYHHAPKIDESVTTMSGVGQISFYSFYYYLTTMRLLLRQLIYVYILAYPMSLFPVDRYRKWGFEGVVGIFFDRVNSAILKAYLGENNINKIRSSLKNFPSVKSLLEWYEEQTDLTEEELENSWRSFLKDTAPSDNTISEGERIARFNAHTRMLGWVLNYVQKPSAEDEISDEAIEKAMKRLHDW